MKQVMMLIKLVTMLVLMLHKVEQDIDDRDHNLVVGDSQGFPRLIFFGVSGKVPCLVS